MGKRVDLNQILAEIAPNVYFQPTANIKMAYPCIVYEYDYANTQFAGNLPYMYTQRYQVTAIYEDKDADIDIPRKIAMLPMTLFSRFFIADKLNHTVFTTYF